MKRIVIKLTGYTILLGVIALSLNFLFPTPVVTYIQQINNNGFIMYKLDLFNYVRNLEQSITSTPIFIIDIFDREWLDVQGGWNDPQFWNAIINNMAYILDIIIAAINIFLFPMRLAAYVIQIYLSVIGLPLMNPTGNPLEWLIVFIKQLTILQIPYV